MRISAGGRHRRPRRSLRPVPPGPEHQQTGRRTFPRQGDALCGLRPEPHHVVAAGHGHRGGRHRPTDAKLGRHRLSVPRDPVGRRGAVDRGGPRSASHAGATADHSARDRYRAISARRHICETRRPEREARRLAGRHPAAVPRPALLSQQGAPSAHFPGRGADSRTPSRRREERRHSPGFLRLFHRRHLPRRLPAGSARYLPFGEDTLRRKHRPEVPGRALGRRGYLCVARRQYSGKLRTDPHRGHGLRPSRRRQ